MVKHPADYPWSSYRYNGQGQNNPLITPHPPIWTSLKHQVYLGDDAFMDEIQTKIKSTRDAKHDLKEIPRMQRRVLAKPLAWYEAQSPSRDEGIVEAYLSGDYAMKEIAEWFGVHYSTVSRAIKRSEQND